MDTTTAVVGLVAVAMVMGSLVAISAFIINAVVKVKLAKYNSLRHSDIPAKAQEGVWPPPPSSPGN